MKIYIVYDRFAQEIGLIKSKDLNSAEKKAKKLFGQSFVIPTEVSKEEERNAL